jgi:hypothetical protein
MLELVIARQNRGAKFPMDISVEGGGKKSKC